MLTLKLARFLANCDRAATAGGLARCAGSLGRSGCQLELGDGTIVRYRVGELIPVYRSQRALYSDCFRTATPAAPRCVTMTNACRRKPAVRSAIERLRASDDLLLVGGCESARQSS